jgi:glutaredoxin
MKKSLMFVVLFLLLVSSAFAMDVTFFSSSGCPHCANVISSGVLEEIESMDGVNLEKFSASEAEGFLKYKAFHEKYNISSGVPLLVIEDGEKYTHILGDTPIIENAVDVINNLEEFEGSIEDEKSITQTLESAFNKTSCPFSGTKRPTLIKLSFFFLNSKPLCFFEKRFKSIPQ